MAKEEWDPEILVTEELAATCISNQFPQLNPIESIRCIGQGWDNKVFLLNDSWIFRFPHRQIAAELIEQENRVLSCLQDSITLAIPNPDYQGKPDTLFPYSFHGYKMLKGNSGCHTPLSMNERKASIKPLALFLKELHSFNEKRAIEIGAKAQVFDRTNKTTVLTNLKERVGKISDRKILQINKDCFEYELQKIEKIQLPNTGKVLVHGDLYSRHLLFNQGKLTGIIDWGDLGINNPAVDLAVVFSFYPNSCHRDFFNHYGDVEENAWQYARFLGLYSALTCLLYGSDIGDQLLAIQSKQAIHEINPNLF